MTKRKHRRHSIPFERMIVEAYFNGTAPNGLSVVYNICRHLIRTWIDKNENAEFVTETAQPEHIPEYEAGITALERRVGRQAPEIEFLQTACRRTTSKTNGISSIVAGPPASLSDEGANKWIWHARHSMQSPKPPRKTRGWRNQVYRFSM